MVPELPIMLKLEAGAHAPGLRLDCDIGRLRCMCSSPPVHDPASFGFVCVSGDHGRSGGGGMALVKTSTLASRSRTRKQPSAEVPEAAAAKRAPVRRRSRRVRTPASASGRRPWNWPAASPRRPAPSRNCGGPWPRSPAGPKKPPARPTNPRRRHRHERQLPGQGPRAGRGVRGRTEVLQTLLTESGAAIDASVKAVGLNAKRQLASVARDRGPGTPCGPDRRDHQERRRHRRPDQSAGAKRRRSKRRAPVTTVAVSRWSPTRSGPWPRPPEKRSQDVQRLAERIASSVRDAADRLREAARPPPKPRPSRAPRSAKSSPPCAAR